ncbi:SET domain-containing protein, partial [Gryllus bimaculatus]
AWCVRVRRINEELETVDANDVRALEAFLKKYRNVLHSHHYLALSAKHSLAQLYGKAQGFTIHELSDELLARKRDICRELVRVFDVLEPGLTRLRVRNISGRARAVPHAPARDFACNRACYAALLILATRGFEARAIAPKELAARLQEVVACLEEAARILALEPDTSAEGIMGQAAADALLRMRDWHRAVDAL